MILIIVVSLLACVNAHSWIACTDYAEKNAAYWDPTKCRGFARAGYKFTPKDNFGIDTGYNFHASEPKPCKLSRNDGANYNEEYPMAIYYPGQQVVLAHPMKNHGADTDCTNPYIPDNGNHIYMAPKNSRTDVSLSEFKQRLVADLGKSPTGHGLGSATQVYPKPGYQNSPAFCENTDRALGTYSFNIPRNLSPGVYTFLWTWGFNSVNDLYSSCFEVQVASKPERDQEIRRRGYATNVACGGTTSDGSTRGSTLGCDGTVLPVTTTRRPPSPTTTTRRPIFTRPTTTTRQPQPANDILSVNMRQLAGTIELPEADKSIFNREISVHFDCPVRATFWPISKMSKYNHDKDGQRRRRKRHAEADHYDIILSGRSKAQQTKIYFHATFSKDCNIVLYPPIAKMVTQE